MLMRPGGRELQNMTWRKVLCMEFIHGAKIMDVPKLNQMDINKHEVAQLLAKSGRTCALACAPLLARFSAVG
jgi:serine/threonine-protein kinase RIO1